MLDALGKSRNESLLNGTLALQVTLHAQDWIEKTRIVDATDRFEFHHVFPEQDAKSYGYGDSDVLVNNVVILGRTNGKLRDTRPADVLSRSDISRHAIKSHGIDLATMESNDFASFVERQQMCERSLSAA